MAIATAPAAAGVSSRADLDAAVEELRGRSRAWLEMPLERKIRFAETVLDGLGRIAERQVAAALAAKGLPADEPIAGEEWFAGPYVQLRGLRLLLDSLRQIRDNGRVAPPADRLVERGEGQLAVRVFPGDLLDGLLFRGFSAEVWMQPGVTRDNLAAHVGMVYREPAPRPAVALVLGAGNVASIPTLDAVHKLFAEGRPTLLKFNPVNDYLGPLVAEAFGELIDAGFVRLAYGGAEVGEYLCRHPGIDEIHVTGSERTHDAIVYGTGGQGAARKRNDDPLLDKKITSELGNVSPMIVLPGNWSDADLEFQAQNLATQMVQNGGFNCNATKVIVTARDWPQRRELLGRLRRTLTRLPPRPAYYPGAEERFERFVAAYPQSELLGVRRPGVLPPALAVDVDPEQADGLALREESFCAFTVETALPAGDAGELLERAVEFCNDRLHGTLNAGLIVEPRTERALGETVERAVAQLRYGSVAINHWPAMAYGLGSTPWGGFPGQPLSDVQSGRGFVHNSWLFERPQKSVVRGPFRVTPKPAWFVTHAAAHRVGRELTALERDRSLLHLPTILWHALRG